MDNRVHPRFRKNYNTKARPFRVLWRERAWEYRGTDLCTRTSCPRATPAAFLVKFCFTAYWQTPVQRYKRSARQDVEKAVPTASCAKPRQSHNRQPFWFNQAVSPPPTHPLQKSQFDQKTSGHQN